MKNSESDQENNSEFRFLATDYLGFYTPGRVFAILARAKQTNAVAVWIGQIGLSPKPFAIGRVFVKEKAFGS